MTARLGRPQSMAGIMAELIDPVPHPVYRGIVMRSALETHFARHLDDEGIAWRYEPAVYGDYLPDFELVDADPVTFIEVKPRLVDVELAEQRMTVIWRSHPAALLVVACAETCAWFGAVAGGAWTSWIDRWAH